VTSPALDFARDGAARFPDAFALPEVDRLRGFQTGAAGARLADATLAEALMPATRCATTLIGPEAMPVRAVMFDKTAEQNWALGWHQDRTITVRERIETEGFGPWTMKQGILHVAPPMAVLARMITLRIHLDDCAADNAPLKVARGSHRLGWVRAESAAQQASALPCLVCEAKAGDIWAYATPILHASERATNPSRRRVLQVDYAAFRLPGGLEWLGLAR